MKRSTLIEKLIPYKRERNIELALEELDNPNTEDISNDEIHSVWHRVSKVLDHEYSNDDHHPLLQVEAQLAATYDRKAPKSQRKSQMESNKEFLTNWLKKYSGIASLASICISLFVISNEYNLDDKVANAWDDFFYPLPPMQELVDGCREKAKLHDEYAIEFVRSTVSVNKYGCLVEVPYQNTSSVIRYEFKYDRIEKRWL
ncbi:hypothetical protein [Vibrio sp. R78045]|uniref:hypothetical protein n=1 Tax=Vibrio sp. R78045 TaxID=3093868 RepID=UPI0036F41DFD